MGTSEPELAFWSRPSRLTRELEIFAARARGGAGLQCPPRYCSPAGLLSGSRWCGKDATTVCADWAGSQWFACDELAHQNGAVNTIGIGPWFETWLDDYLKRRACEALGR